jgi:hypothetical protein
VKEKVSDGFVEVANFWNINQKTCNHGVAQKNEAKKFPPALAQHNLFLWIDGQNPQNKGQK